MKYPRMKIDVTYREKILKFIKISKEAGLFNSPEHDISRILKLKKYFNLISQHRNYDNNWKRNNISRQFTIITFNPSTKEAHKRNEMLEPTIN